MTNATDGSIAPVDIDWARFKALYDEQEILIVFDWLGWERQGTRWKAHRKKGATKKKPRKR